MYLITNPTNQQIFNSFESYRNNRISDNNSRVINSLPQDKQQNAEKFNLPAFCSTAAGILLSLIFVRKYKSLQNNFTKLTAESGIKNNLNAVKNNVMKFLDINYGLKEMIILGSGSIAGGLAGGIIFDKKEKTKAKMQEAIYQFANLAIPTSLAAGLMHLAKNSKSFNNRYAQIVAAVVGIGMGMPLSSAICHKINNGISDKNQKYHRPMKLKDGIIHLDDIIMALVLTRLPLVKNLCIDKLIPFLYLYCGYESGKHE